MFGLDQWDREGGIVIKNELFQGQVSDSFGNISLITALFAPDWLPAQPLTCKADRLKPA
jgi:hypothetical protein